MILLHKFLHAAIFQNCTSGSREHIGPVVECLTRDRGAVGSSLTGVTTLWLFSKVGRSIPPLVLTG